MMAGAFVTLHGHAQAVRKLRDTADAVATIGGLRLALGNPQPYFRAIETGRRGGRPWRRAGGAWMAREGTRETAEQVSSLIVAEIRRGGRGAGKHVEDAIRRVWLTNVQRRTPVRTGQLRDRFFVRRLR